MRQILQARSSPDRRLERTVSEAMKLKTEKLQSFLGLAETLWLQISIAFLLVLGLEICADGYYSLFPRQYEDPMLQAQCFRDQSWSKEYFHELHACLPRIQWNPYNYWRLKDFHGRYVNVNVDGIRRTWRQPDLNGLDSRKRRIFMFGGSTMFGNGARDEYTIPSLVARHLATDSHLDVEVTNFGVPAFVNTQEFILLFEQMRKGNKPDLVDFYDGANDVFSAFQNRVAGVTLDETAREQEFGVFNNSDAWPLYSLTLKTALQHSALGSLAKRVVQRMRPDSYQIVDGRLVRSASLSESADEGLAAETAKFYMANVMTIQQIGQQSGFKSLFYLQPEVYFKNHLTPFERKRQLPFANVDRFFRLANQAVIAEDTGGRVHDLSKVFADLSGEYFLDFCHLNEAGNEMVAEAMLPSVVSALRELDAGSNPRAPLDSQRFRPASTNVTH